MPEGSSCATVEAVCSLQSPQPRRQAAGAIAAAGGTPARDALCAAGATVALAAAAFSPRSGDELQLCALHALAAVAAPHISSAADEADATGEAELQRAVCAGAAAAAVSEPSLPEALWCARAAPRKPLRRSCACPQPEVLYAACSCCTSRWLGLLCRLASQQPGPLPADVVCAVATPCRVCETVSGLRCLI